MTEKLNIDKEYLIKKYIDENLSSYQIAKELGVNPSTIQRRVNEYDLKKEVKTVTKNTVNKKDQKSLDLIIKAGYTPEEIKEFIQGIQKQQSNNSKDYNIGKEHVKIGVSGDYHLGNINTDYDLMEHYLKTTEKEKVDFHLNTGDIFDGWYQNRPSSIFEQNAIGFDRQMELAVKFFKKLNAPLYFITGNHSYNTFVRGAGVEAGPHLEDKLKLENVESKYLGNAEGSVVIGDNCKITMMHPDGGTAYALSYRPQKIIESLESGQKPNILLIGHYHKIEQLFYRNVHAFQTGTMMGQTKFMKGKSIPAHKGFWILDIWSGKNGQVDKIIPQLYTSYK